jgi:hypothetical protein
MATRSAAKAVAELGWSVPGSGLYERRWILDQDGEALQVGQAEAIEWLSLNPYRVEVVSHWIAVPTSRGLVDVQVTTALIPVTYDDRPFQTCISGGYEHGYKALSATHEQALREHDRACQLVKLYT